MNTPYVLWIAKPERLEAPQHIFCPGTMRAARDWKQSNTWAYTTPLSLFGTDKELRPLGKPFMHPAKDENVPCRAENVPSAAWNGEPWGEGDEQYPWTPPLVSDFPEQLAVYGRFVARCAASVGYSGVRRLWVVCGGDDGGVCALWAAKGMGLPVVCLSRTPPGILANQISLESGIPISYRETSGGGIFHA